MSVFDKEKLGASIFGKKIGLNTTAQADGGTVDGAPKRKLGRPKGSKNKPKMFEARILCENVEDVNKVMDLARQMGLFATFVEKRVAKG